MFVLFFLHLLLILKADALPSEILKESDQLNSSLTEVNHIASSSLPPTLPPCRDHYSIPQLIFPTCTSANGPSGLRNVIYHGIGCTCDLNTHDINKRDDYQYTENIGIHKFHTRGATFNTARKICNEEGAHLAIIETAAEERVRINHIYITEIRYFFFSRVLKYSLFSLLLDTFEFVQAVCQQFEKCNEQ